MLMSRLRNQDGMTLPELLVTLAIAVIVSLAAFALIETVMHQSGEVSARVETTQRGRIALDDMTRGLRSQVCVTRSDPALMTAPRSIYEATRTSVTFFADTADESWRTGVTAMPVPTLRKLELVTQPKSDASAPARLMLTESITPGQNDAANAGAVRFNWAGVTTKTRRVLTDITLIKRSGVDVPIFRYYAFNSATPPEPKLELDPGTGSLNETQLQSIARITVTYRVNPTAWGLKRGETEFEDDVYVRIADPNSPTPKPTCA